MNFFYDNCFKTPSPNLYQKIAFHDGCLKDYMYELWLNVSVCSFNLYYHTFLWFTTCKNLHRDQMGRGRQLQVVMVIILVMTMKREKSPIHMHCWFILQSFILMCIVNCHLTFSCSEWCCETGPVSELLVKSKLRLGKNVSDLGSFA